MKFDVDHHAPFPRQAVFEAHRDAFTALALHMDEVKSVRERSRSKAADGTVTVKNRWHGSKAVLPFFMRPLVPEEILIWEDESRFDPRTWRCDWVITIPGLGPMADVRGAHVFTDDGEGTRIHLEGVFAFHPERAPQVRLPPGAVPLVEKVVVSIIVALLEKSALAMITHLHATR